MARLHVWKETLASASLQNGFFDPDEVTTQGKQIHTEAIAKKADNSFEQAWRKYHDSFANNADATLNSLYGAFMANYRYITPLNLNGTVILFKELGRPDQALEMIKTYVEGRDEGRDFFDLAQNPFVGSGADPDVMNAFEKKLATFKDTRDAARMLLDMKEHGWNDQILASLSTVPIEEYVRALKSNEGKDLRRIIEAGLQFDRISNASDRMREVSRRMREALSCIGRESAINARRVSKFGID